MTDTITPAVTPAPIKPGWQCSEFWLSLAAIVIGAVSSSGLLPAMSKESQIAGIITAVLASLGYTASRTITKQNQ